MPFSSGVVRGNFELLTGFSYVYAIAEFIVASIAIIMRIETTSFFTRIPPLIHFSYFVLFLLRQTGYSGLPCELLPSFKIIIFKHYFCVKYFFSYRIHNNYVYSLQIHFHLFDNFRLSSNIKNCLSFIN